ncbi:kelch-like protein 26 [Glandiceps talaboti]
MAHLHQKSKITCCTAPNYGNSIIQAFQQLHEEDLFHDVTLLSEDFRSYQAHRQLLVASSDYFKAMFSVGMRESQEMEVHLQGVPSEGLSSILDFIYSGKLYLSMQTLDFVLSAAVHLQINEAIELCKEFMSSTLTAITSVKIYQLAQLFCFTDIERLAFDCILNHFNIAARQVDFHFLSTEQVVNFLKRNDIKECSEVDLFEIAVSWVEHDKEARRCSASQVMKKIRFPLMPVKDLERKVWRVDFMRDVPKCARLLDEALDYQRNPYLQNQKQTCRTQVRGTEQAICVVGGMKDQLDSQVTAYKIGEDVIELAEMEESMHVHSAAMMDGFLYSVGGWSLGSPTEKKVLASTHRYDPRINQWIQLASMNTGRTNFSLCVFNGKLYALGGITEVSESTSQRTGSVEVYTPENNCWQLATPLMSSMSCHAGAVLFDEIYLTGGDVYVNGKSTNTAMIYDPISGNMMEKAPMKVARYLHGMCVLNEKIYVIGGVNQSSSRTRSDVSAVECYDPHSDFWQILDQIPFSRSVFSPVVLEDKIYILGGYSSMKQRETSAIIVYDPAVGWHVAGSMVSPVSGHTCCLLTLPNTLPDPSIAMAALSIQTTV